jgi:hypothetical protein
MLKLKIATSAVIGILLQMTLSAQANQNDVSVTHKLLDSKGRVVGTEVRSQPKAHPRVRSASRRSTMIQAIHEAARRPEYVYRTYSR